MSDEDEIAIPADPNDPEDRPAFDTGLKMAHRGRKLRMTRTGLGLTQEVFAGLLGVSPVELLAWEQVRQEIPEDIMSKAQAIKDYFPNDVNRLTCLNLRVNPQVYNTTNLQAKPSAHAHYSLNTSI